jgi:NADPH:quinone reductase-like Zn-dependent oxidoreductase
VRAVSLHRSGWEALQGQPLSARSWARCVPPPHPGSDIAGPVAATGPTTTSFQPGDEVFADLLSPMGGFAEYVCVPERALAPVPAAMS